MVKSNVVVVTLVLLLCATDLLAETVMRANVIEIPKTPVFWAQPPRPEQAAQVGTSVQQGGYLRTVQPGKAQIQLSNGLYFRLGGNAILQIGRDLRLESGQIIAWLKPGLSQDQVFHIQVAPALVSIKQATVFIDRQPASTRFFSWEGEVTVQLPASQQQIVLKSGQELTLDQNATQFSQIKTLSHTEVEERFQKSPLLNGFTVPMETLPEIKRELLLTRSTL